MKDKSTGIYVTVILTSIINGLTALTAVFGNAVFLFVFLKVTSIRTPSNILLACLSVTDLLVGIIVQPTSVARRILEANDIHDCALRVTYAFFGFLSSGASFLNIGLISIDRCIAICCPFWYEISATGRSHCTIVLTMWFIWAAITVLPFAGVLSLQAYFIGVFTVLFTNVFIVIISYAFIARVIIAKKRYDIPQQVSSVAINTVVNTNEVAETPELFRKPQKHLCPDAEQHVVTENRIGQRTENKTSRNSSTTIAILVVCMLVCYAPQLTVLLMRGALGDDVNLVFIADTWVDTITFINSSINPLIYWYRLTDIRNAVSRVLRRRTRPSPITFA